MKEKHTKTIAYYSNDLDILRTNSVFLYSSQNMLNTSRGDSANWSLQWVVMISTPFRGEFELDLSASLFLLTLQRRNKNKSGVEQDRDKTSGGKQTLNQK